MSTALVLGGGGVAGIAWMLGYLSGRPELLEADVLIGTSAGACVATQVATGQLDAAVAMQQRVETAERAIDLDVDRFVAGITAAAQGATSPQDAARRIAQLPTPPESLSAPERRAIVAARLPVPEWPARDLRIVAVERATGRRVTFDRASGAPLVDAVTASCAVPGVWPPAPVDGREYVDGGAHSNWNADLAAGADAVTVLVALAPDEAARERLDAEVATLGAAAVEVVVVDAGAVDAIGPNPLDPGRRAAALAAGRRQAAA